MGRNMKNFKERKLNTSPFASITVLIYLSFDRYTGSLPGRRPQPPSNSQIYIIGSFPYLLY